MVFPEDSDPIAESHKLLNGLVYLPIGSDVVDAAYGFLVVVVQQVDVGVTDVEYLPFSLHEVV